MDAPLDLYGGSRDQLLALVVGQRERIAALAARQARQEAERAQQRVVIGQWLVSDLYAVYTVLRRGATSSAGRTCCAT